MLKIRPLRLLTFSLLSGGLLLISTAQSQAQEKVPNDQEIVNNAGNYSLDKLVELLGVYDRLGKRQVTQALADEILKREPNNASALAVKEGRPVAPNIEGEGAAETPEDRLANSVYSLQKRRRYGELISLLNKSKRGYKGAAFPFQDDLADAYYETGNLSAAKSAYSEMANSSKYTNASRALARKNLQDIQNTERIAKAHELSMAGDHGSALDILEDIKGKHKGGTFPYENDLGDILLAAGDFEAAESAYASVANGRGYTSTQRAAAKAGLRDVMKGRKLRDAHVALRDKRSDEAQAIADELESAGYTNDEDVAYLRAEVAMEKGNLGKAIDSLSQIKEKKYRGKPFPAQSDLASALYRSNRLHEAAEAYDEIITGKYLPLEQEEASIELRELTRELNGSLAFDIGYVTEEEGDTWHTSVTAKSPVYDNGLRYWVFARRDDLELSSDTSLRSQSGERFEGGFAIEKFIDQTLSVAGYVGGSESDNGDSDQILFGGSFEKRAGRGTWGMDFAYNERADDSIGLQVLDGRQHRIQANFDMPITDRIYADGFIYYRQVEALGEELGTGYGGQLDLLYTVREANRNSPAFRVGYAGEYHKFSANSLDAGRFSPVLKSGIPADEVRGLASDFVEEEINLHGLKVVVEGRVSQDVSYFVSGAIQYDFFDEEFQYSAGTGLEVYLNERTRLVGGVEYYSAGQTSSTDEGVIVGTLGVSITF